MDPAMGRNYRLQGFHGRSSAELVWGRGMIVLGRLG
jgi:hypothetical protein